MAISELQPGPADVKPPAAIGTMTAADYLTRERDPARTQEPKCEFIHGQVFEMSGASFLHDRVKTNLNRLLYAALDSDRLYVGSSDLKVGLAGEIYVYPDISVAEEPVELLTPQSDIVARPLLIAEVLSPTTERYDRGLKAAAYRELPSLEDLLLIAQDRRHVAHFCRSNRGWLLNEFTQGDTVHIDGLDLDLPLDALYRGVLPPNPAAR